jgi:transcriptional regulator with XRE-family HTH domain
MTTGIGDTLRTARREQGRTIADAAAETRVREAYLAALEEEEFSTVGGNVYVKGFLRSYARYLGVDPDPLVDRFRAEFERPEDQAAIVHQPLPPVGRVGRMGPMGARQGPSRTVTFVAIVIAILFVLGLIGLASGHDQQAAAPVPSPVGGTGATALPPGGGSARGQPSARSAPSMTASGAVEPFRDLVVELDVERGESYIRSDAGEPGVDGVKQAGYTETFHSGLAGKVSLRIGDASHVRLIANGRDLGRLGGRGRVVQVTCEVGGTECDILEIVPR